MLSHPNPSLVQVAESGPSMELVRFAAVQRHTSKSLRCFALVICIPLKFYFVGACLSPLRVFLSEPQSINLHPKVTVSKLCCHPFTLKLLHQACKRVHWDTQSHMLHILSSMAPFRITHTHLFHSQRGFMLLRLSTSDVVKP
jgi:hypothetical protein